jgi:Flp pilus assembly protein TadG
MKLSASVVRRFRERGGAAVEAAILFPILAIILAGPAIYLARFFWHYEVAQKAAHDAALFLSKATNVEMQTFGPAGEVAIATLARNVATMEMAELSPGSTPPPPSVLCEYQVTKTTTSWSSCNGLLVPLNVKVTVAFAYVDGFFDADQLIWVDVPVRYVGN